MARILVVDDERDYLLALDAVLAREGHEVVGLTSPREALERAEGETFDCVVADLRMPELSGLELLKGLKQIDGALPVILLTAHATVPSAVSALREGAFHYLEKPFKNDELVAAVAKASELAHLRRQSELLRDELALLLGSEFLGTSPAMRRVFELIQQVAPTRSTVLITGESGTGKELTARAIHRASDRAQGPFVAFNVAAVAHGLVESELFGHERGSFTGAHQRRRGRFELAHGGTLFLDEIGETSPALQANLLRVLQEGELERVGGEQSIRVDVRVIAATNRDLAAMVAAGTFREDLYYRLNVVPIALPPLRERREDIPLLALHFLRRYARDLKKPVSDFTEEATRALVSYPWPGNVRELQNAIERVVVLARGPVIGVEQLPIPVAKASVPDEDPDARVALPERFDLKAALERIERRYLLKALRDHGWVQARAATALGLSRSHLKYKLDKHGIDPETRDTDPRDADA